MAEWHRALAAAAGISSIAITAAYALYAGGNTSGHTSFSAYEVLLPLQGAAAIVGGWSLMMDRAHGGPRSVIPCISLAAALGGIGFLFFLDRLGILREYNSWASSGLEAPPEERLLYIFDYLIVFFLVLTLLFFVCIRQEGPVSNGDPDTQPE